MFSSAVGGGRWRGALRTSATQSPTRRSPRATPCSWWATTSVKQSPARAAIETSAACCGAVYTTRRTAAASELKWKPATPPDIAPSRRAPRSSRRRFCPRLKSMAEEPARASSSVRLRSARMVAAKPSSSLATRAPRAEKTRTPRPAPEAPSIYLQAWFLMYLERTLGSFPTRALRSSQAPAENPPGWGRSSGPRGDLVVQNRIEGVVQLQPSTFADFGDKTMSASQGHPCDETAVAVLLGTPKLSSPPCFLAREISAPTAP